MTLCVAPPMTEKRIMVIVLQTNQLKTYVAVGSLIIYLMNLQTTPSYAAQSIGIGYPKNNPISHARR
jgi:hypothetical protein